jgi:hypothetical protein
LKLTVRRCWVLSFISLYFSLFYFIMHLCCLFLWSHLCTMLISISFIYDYFIGYNMLLGCSQNFPIFLSILLSLLGIIFYLSFIILFLTHEGLRTRTSTHQLPFKAWRASLLIPGPAVARRKSNRAAPSYLGRKPPFQLWWLSTLYSYCFISFISWSFIFIL